ncbi:hypothetical protein CW304_03285 [Bacillus sp. UFRGS-B20]|nr:hypothetical protein CW304_03285 [Bacillus sp. UFRGS-B20]
MVKELLPIFFCHSDHFWTVFTISINNVNNTENTHLYPHFCLLLLITIFPVVLELNRGWITTYPLFFAAVLYHFGRIIPIWHLNRR